jgi:hypothetical protein
MKHLSKQYSVRNFQKKYYIINNFLTVGDKISKQKYDIFEIIFKKSHAENFSQMGATLGAGR